MTQPAQHATLDEIASEDLIGRTAHLVLHPEVVGQITSVHIYDTGRSYTFQWYVEDQMKAVDLNGFQLELVE